MLSRSSLLLVEDDYLLSHSLTRQLRSCFTVDQVTTLSGALAHLTEKDYGYDVVVLDRLLPDGDSRELLEVLQRDFPYTRVCILTGILGEEQMVDCLKTGADVYLTKPLTAKTVSYHVQALMKRGKIMRDNTLAFQDLFLDLRSRQVQRSDNQTIRLSKREVECLARIIQSHGQVTQEELWSVFWKAGIEASSGLIHVTIQRLRKKLAPLGVTIRAIYGLGYTLELT